MHPVRRIICSVLAAALLGGGLYILYYMAIISHSFMIRMIGIGVFLVVLGGFWLWADCIEPLLHWMKRRPPESVGEPG